MNLFRRKRKTDEVLGAEAVYLLDALAAREDIVVYASRVLRNESTGKLVGADGLMPFHVDFLRRLLDPEVKRLAVAMFPGAGKTTLEAVAVSLLVLRAAAGQQAQPVLYFGPNASVAEGFCRAVKKIATSPEALAIFPEGASLRWTATQCELEDGGRLPLLVCGGPEARSLSRRGALQIADDIQDPRQVRSKDARERSEQFFNEVLMTRHLDAESRVVVSAAPYSSLDLVSQLSKREGWQVIAVRALTRDGDSSWPARFPLGRLEEIRRDRPRVWRVAYMLDASSGHGASLITDAAIETAIRAGRGMACADGGEGFSAWQGESVAVLSVDPAFSISPNADATGVVAVSIEADGRRRVVDCREYRMGPAELAREVCRLAARYHPRAITIEDAGAQSALIALVRALQPTLHLVPAKTTSASKWSEREGLPALARSFEAGSGMWCLPSTMDGTPTPSSKLLADALRSTQADVEVHTPDCTMALLFAHTLISRSEGIGWFDPAAEFGFDPRLR